MTLFDYVQNHTSADSKEIDVAEPYADLVFFRVRTKNSPDVDMLKMLIAEQKGDQVDLNIFDGKEHSYIEIGGWIGDQGVAMRFMGMLSLMEMATLMTPLNMLPGLPDDLAVKMAQQGFITIKVAV
jgi:hypothetical protein